MVCRTICIALLFVLTHTAGNAAVWRVEKDGTGDFLQIQEAVEAAASGDTIAIGPGLWMKFQEFQAPGGTFEAIAYPQQESITFLGAGVDATILAYAFGPAGPDHPNGIVAGVATSLHVEALSLVDLNRGVQANGPAVAVKNARFERNVLGIASWSWMGTYVDSCGFVDGDIGVVVFRGLGAKNVQIVDSSFDGCNGGVDLQSELPGRVQNCSFRSTRVGVQVSFGGSANVLGCTFAATGNVGVALVQQSSCNLRNSVFDKTATGNNLFVGYASTLEGTGNVLKGGIPTMEAFSGAVINFSGNNILNSGGTSVGLLGNAPNPPAIDLTNNYWGTTDLSQIAEWIHDNNDDPSVTGVVLFDPIAEQSVPTRSTSIGSVKARY